MSIMTYNLPDHIKNDTFNELQFTVTVNGTPLNLTAASIKMDVKINNLPATAITKTLSTTNNLISIVNATAGIFKIVKQVISINAATYVYDIQITLQGGDIYTYIKGHWTILQDVTVNG